MKKSLLVLVAVLMSVVAMAQAPQKMTYQAVVRDNDGRLVSNGNVGVKITIVRGLETGTEVYSQTESLRTNGNGLFTTMIGGSGFEGIDWGNGPYYLKSEVDPDGGSNYILTTTQQMMSVPYALHAGTVDNIIGGVNVTENDPIFTAWDKDYNDLINKPNFADSVSRIVNEYHLGDTIINYISQNGYVDSSYVINYNTQQGYVDTSYITNYINNIGSVTNETDPVFTAWDKDYNDLINKPTIPTAVSELSNDAGYMTSYTEVQSLGDVTAIGNAANSQLKEVSDPTEEMDAVNLRTLNAVVADWSHRFDSLAHRFDSIANSLDSIIAYQDSVIDTLSNLLAELGVTEGDTTAVECERFNWYGTEYTVSGDYQHRLTNVAGFDSVLTMHLTIKHGTHNAESQTACDSYTWHGNDYTASGTYTYDYTNGIGCASTDSLHLTINASNAATDVHTECDSYTWIDGNTYTASNSTATHTLTNVAGCDSVLTLNLTINSSTHNAEMQTVAGSYTWHENTYTASGNYTYSYTNAAGCASVDTLHLTIGGFDANGASVALFSVSATKQVRFSKGNLQYTTTGTHTVSGGGTAEGTWRFAENQYDYIGSSNSYITYNYTGWIDLFCWGTSGWSSGAECWFPYCFGTANTYYNPGGSDETDLIGTYARADWGVYNSISNGGNQPEMWRTLTSEEWSYLVNTRNGSSVNGTENARFFWATVNGEKGLVLLPDEFIMPTGISSPGGINSVSAGYSRNTYNATQWSKLEMSGAIFLPAAGRRRGNGSGSIGFMGEEGHYWSSKSYHASFQAKWLHFYKVSGEDRCTLGVSSDYRSYGASVRLVMDAE